MTFPLSSILYFLMAGVFFFFAGRVHWLYKKSPSLFSRYFRNVGFFSGIASTIYALMGVFFTDNSLALGWGNVIGEPFYLISFVYMIAVFFHLTFPQISEKKVINFGLILVFFTIISHIKFFPLPFIDERGILNFNAPIVPGLTFVFFSVLALLPLTFVFIKEAIVKKNLRIRSGLLSGALLLFFAGGTVQSLAETSWLYAFSFLFQALAFTFLFLGIIFKVKQEDNQSLKDDLPINS